jgi:sarcosine oxidase subunit alpha
VDGEVIDGPAWLSAGWKPTVAARDNVTLIRSAPWRLGVYDHGYVLADERSPTTRPATGGRSTGCGASAPARSSPPTGAIERPLSFAGNDIPGVMLAGAVRDYVVNWASRPATAPSSSPTTTSAYRTAWR